MAIEAPVLPYERNALTPHMSEETLDYHFGKHHMTYYNKLLAAKGEEALKAADLEEFIKTSSGGDFNNAAQIWNHSFFWNCLSASGGGSPTGAIAEAITRDFGSFESFKTKFNEAAAGLFGSGWVFLIQANGKLEIKGYQNAGTPVKEGEQALLTVDVWEHAYYIDHRNSRPNFLESFWNLVNWDFVNKQL